MASRNRWQQKKLGPMPQCSDGDTVLLLVGLIAQQQPFLVKTKHVQTHKLWQMLPSLASNDIDGCESLCGAPVLRVDDNITAPLIELSLLTQKRVAELLASTQFVLLSGRSSKQHGSPPLEWSTNPLNQLLDRGSAMSTDASAMPEVTPPATGKCPLGGAHIHRDEVRQIFKECQEESFKYRALPLSLGSLAVTGALLYKGVLTPSKRFGPFPKLAVAGILGYVLGKASYVRTCREKFHRLGLESPHQPFGPGFKRHCHHVCSECEKKKSTAPSESVA